jgi:hypothetical protein
MAEFLPDGTGARGLGRAGTGMAGEKQERESGSGADGEELG